MFAFYENKIYGGYMKQMSNDKAREFALLRKRKAAGANPAESIFCSGRNSGVKSASGSGCEYQLVTAPYSFIFLNAV